MVNFKLIPYTIRIKHEDSADFLQLDDLKGTKAELIKKFYSKNPKSLSIKFSTEQAEELQKTDLFYILKKYFSSIQDPYILKDHQKTICLEKIEEIDRNIFGIIKGGEFGISADIFDTINNQRIIEARKTTDAEELPFFFHIYIPEEKNAGYIILEMIGVHGISMQLEDHLNQYLDSMKNSIFFQRMISHDLFDQMRASELKEIKMIKRVVPRDVADKVHQGNSEDIIEERIFKAKRNKIINIPNDLLNQLKNKEITQYEFFNDHFNEIKTIIKQNKVTRTATFGIQSERMGELMYLGDIPLIKGHPGYEKIKELSIQYMTNLSKES